MTDCQLAQGHCIELNYGSRGSPAMGMAVNYLGGSKWRDAQLNATARCDLGELTQNRFDRRASLLLVHVVTLIRY
jgi:hypothetical protein